MSIIIVPEEREVLTIDKYRRKIKIQIHTYICGGACFADNTCGPAGAETMKPIQAGMSIRGLSACM